MSQPCAIPSCEHSSCALCHCCKQNICLPHLNEHQNSLASQLELLANRFNVLKDCFDAFTTEEQTANARLELAEWRTDCYQQINDLYEQKTQELNKLITAKKDKQGEEIARFRSEFEHVHKKQATRQDIHSLTSKIEYLENKVNSIENKRFHIQRQPLIISDHSITIRESRERTVNLSKFSSIYKQILPEDGSSPVLASNNHFLLIHQKPNLSLVTQNLETAKQTLWEYGFIYDMCWSSTLNRFFVVNSENVFLVDPSNMSIENVSTIEKGWYYSCTCSSENLYLSTCRPDSSILVCNLFPSVELIRHWKQPDICQKDDSIRQIKYNNKALALLITDQSNQTIRMKLRSAHTLDKFWSFTWYDRNMPDIVVSCCAVDGDEWLVTDNTSNRLMIISYNGKLKAEYPYHTVPWYACTFGSAGLVISDAEGIKLYRL